MANNNIVLCRQTGKPQLVPEAQQKIERHVAFFLGKVAREFQNGALDDTNVEKADETHFLFTVDNGRALGFRGDETIKYADVTSGGGNDNDGLYFRQEGLFGGESSHDFQKQG